MFKNSIDQSPKFLSTPSARRATRSVRGLVFFTWISIHALREEGDPPRAYRGEPEHRIPIHALREEGDHPYYGYFYVNILFLSTPSARRATVQGQ